MIAASSSRLPQTGAATACRSSSRSPKLYAYPRARIPSSSAPSAPRCVIVFAVYAFSVPGGSARFPKASKTFPVAVACAMLGRPRRATPCTDDGLCTKSTVTASRSPGAESVAVSPVVATSACRCGRAICRRSRRARTTLPSCRRRRPSRYRPESWTCSTRPPATSVASRRETLLALIPVRRAISFVPSSVSASASTSSTLNARCTAPTSLNAGCPVRAIASVLGTSLPTRQP